jgi:hypothetical protein
VRFISNVIGGASVRASRLVRSLAPPKKLNADSGGEGARFQRNSSGNCKPGS